MDEMESKKPGSGGEELWSACGGVEWWLGLSWNKLGLLGESGGSLSWLSVRDRLPSSWGNVVGKVLPLGWNTSGWNGSTVGEGRILPSGWDGKVGEGRVLPSRGDGAVAGQGGLFLYGWGTEEYLLGLGGALLLRGGRGWLLSSGLD